MDSVREKIMSNYAPPKKNVNIPMRRMGQNNNQIIRLGVNNKQVKKRLGV
jgi:hypothetical protein